IVTGLSQNNVISCAAKNHVVVGTAVHEIAATLRQYPVIARAAINHIVIPAFCGVYSEAIVSGVFGGVTFLGNGACDAPVAINGDEIAIALDGVVPAQAHEYVFAHAAKQDVISGLANEDVV